MSQQSDRPVLAEWTFVKARGSIAKTGSVYRSPNGSEYLRTGLPDVLPAEAAFAKRAHAQGFPVPRVTREGAFADGTPFYAETSAGETTFAQQFREDCAETGLVSNETFHRYAEVVCRFLEAQLFPVNKPAGPGALRAGIQLANVLEENPDLPPSQLESAVAKAERRTAGLPLVLSHGDLTPFNVLPRGVIDFENRFVAPFGYDAVTAITFQRFWDHPYPDGTGTAKRYEFSRAQIAEFMARVDVLCQVYNAPGLSPYFDDFLMLKAIWALCYEQERPGENPPPFSRWLWRRRVALYCVRTYLNDLPIASERFRAIGIGEPASQNSYSHV